MDSERLCGAIFVAIPTAIPADQKVREASGKDGGLDSRVVEVILEVYRILMQIGLRLLLGLFQQKHLKNFFKEFLP